MTHIDVFKFFILFFPSYAGSKVDAWYPNGRNSIRIKHTDRQEFIFTYNNPRDWRFETVNSFLNRMEGGKK